MKNAFSFFLITLLFVTFSACRKDRGPKAVGFVVQTGTGTPIEGATVDLYKGDSFTGPWTFDRTLTTGSDGAYEFVIPDNEVYRLSAYHPEYFDVANGYFSLSNNDYAFDASLSPHAYIKLHVENVAPVDEFDNIRVYGFSTLDDPDNIGTDINIDRTYLIRGNKNVEFAWEVIKNGMSTITFDSLYAPAHDTLHYEILY